MNVWTFVSAAHTLYITMAWSSNILLFVLGILLKYEVHVSTCNHKKSLLRHTQTDRERERDVKEKPSQQMMNIKVSVQ
jgi:hypothetical protein